MNLLVEIISTTIPLTIPVLLAALGGAYSWHANVFNVSMEGLLLTSAFFSVAVSFTTGSWFLGLLAGIGASIVVSLLFAFFTLKLKVNEFLTGIAINLFVAGATTYLLRQMFSVKGALISPEIKPLPKINIPIIQDIPILSTILSGHNILVYVGILIIVPLAFINIYRSRFGLRLRGTGFDDKVVDSVGIKSGPIKLKALIICGILCGIGGTSLSLGYMTLFTEGMSSGRGWIALAIIILTKGHPLGILSLAFLFGLLEGIGLSIQSIGIPTEFSQMLPYISTIIALYIFSIKGRKQNKSLLAS